MRILKYIFLLILLALFAVSVFVATQRGDFDIVRTRIIKSPKATVFNYVNDLRNWENFGAWKTDDPRMQFIYPQNTTGKGGSYSWKGADGIGNVKTIDIRENESITQKMNYNGSLSDIAWAFKDTVGGTKVTWRSKGNMDFVFKIYTALNGGAEKVIGALYERSLQNLDKSVNYEISTYHVEVIGQVKKLGTFYLQQRFVSKISNVPKNLRIMIPKLIHFFKKNKIDANGHPFVIYHTYDKVKDLTDMSVCIPVKEQVFTSHGSDITSGKLEPFLAVKSILTGDYSHSGEAIKKADGYFASKNLQKIEDGMLLEIYRVNIDRQKHPSKWVTDLYIPVMPKPVPVVPQPKPFVPAPEIIAAPVQPVP